MEEPATGRRASSQTSGRAPRARTFLRAAVAGSILLAAAAATATGAHAQSIAPSAPTVPARDTLYVGDQVANTVKTFDAVTGFSKGTLVPVSAGLHAPHGIIPFEGDLLVVNQNQGLPIPGEILRFRADDGKLVKRTVPALLRSGASNPNAPGAPDGMVVSDGKIVVADVQDDPNNFVQGSVREYTEAGALIRPLMKAPNAEIDPAQYHPRGVVVGPDGKLYVSSLVVIGGPNGHVVRFDPERRKFIDTFIKNNGTTATDCTKNLNRPDGLVFGPDGNLYVTTFRASGGDPVKQDTDAILVFEGPFGRHPGACIDQIDLDKPGALNGTRAFAQALLFGPRGDLFVPISGNGPDTGAIRRYNVRTHSFTNFAPPGTLVSPGYLAFGKTDPATLAYGDE